MSLCREAVKRNQAREEAQFGESSSDRNRKNNEPAAFNDPVIRNIYFPSIDDAELDQNAIAKSVLRSTYDLLGAGSDVSKYSSWTKVSTRTIETGWEQLLGKKAWNTEYKDIVKIVKGLNGKRPAEGSYILSNFLFNIGMSYIVSVKLKEIEAFERSFASFDADMVRQRKANQQRLIKAKKERQRAPRLEAVPRVAPTPEPSYSPSYETRKRDSGDWGGFSSAILRCAETGGSPKCMDEAMRRYGLQELRGGVGAIVECEKAGGKDCVYRAEDYLR